MFSLDIYKDCRCGATSQQDGSVNINCHPRFLERKQADIRVDIGLELE